MKTFTLEEVQNKLIVDVGKPERKKFEYDLQRKIKSLTVNKNIGLDEKIVKAKNMYHSLENPELL